MQLVQVCESFHAQTQPVVKNIFEMIKHFDGGFYVPHLVVFAGFLGTAGGSVESLGPLVTISCGV